MTRLSQRVERVQVLPTLNSQFITSLRLHPIRHRCLPILSKVSPMPPFQPPKDEATTLQDATEYNRPDNNTTFTVLLALVIFMTIWPWAFFGILMGLGGVAMPSTAARTARYHPQEVSFFVTSLSGVINIIVGYLFSTAVSMLSQKYVAHKNPNIANISFFTHLKNRTFPMSLLYQGRTLLVLIVVLYMSIFNFVTSGISALLTPVIFNRYAQLQATELDFGTTDPACVDWFNNNTISHTCNWMVLALMSTSIAIKTNLCFCLYIGVQRCEFYDLPRRYSAGRHTRSCPWPCPRPFTYFPAFFSDSLLDRSYRRFTTALSALPSPSLVQWVDCIF